MIVHRTINPNRVLLTRMDADSKPRMIELIVAEPVGDSQFHHGQTLHLNAEQATILGNTLMNLAHDLELHDPEHTPLSHAFHPRASRLAADATFPPHPAHDGDAYGGRFLSEDDIDADGPEMLRKEDDTTSD